MTFDFLSRRGLAALIAVALCGVAAVAAPNHPQDPIGYRDYLKTGRYPTRVWLPRPSGAVWLMHPQKEAAQYQIHLASPEDGRPPLLRMSAGHRSIEKVSHGDEVVIDLDAAAGRVVPLFGQLYRFSKFDGEHVRLERVTELVPEELRPDPEARTISPLDELPRLFWSPGSRNDERRYYGLTGLRFENDAASFSLHPLRTIGPDAGDRPVVHVTVKAGEFVTVEKRRYRVTKVVAPRRENDLELAGWIELTDDLDPTRDGDARPDDGMK